MSEKEIAKGPKLTVDDIMSTIKSEQYHVFKDTTVTVCCLTLTNGYTVTGESACVDPRNFDAEIGRQIAKKCAIEKIWSLEGYMLKQRLFCFGK
jgi:hypothetical protein